MGGCESMCGSTPDDGNVSGNITKRNTVDRVAYGQNDSEKQPMLGKDEQQEGEKTSTISEVHDKTSKETSAATTSGSNVQKSERMETNVSNGEVEVHYGFVGVPADESAEKISITSVREVSDNGLNQLHQVDNPVVIETPKGDTVGRMESGSLSLVTSIMLTQPIAAKITSGNDTQVAEGLLMSQSDPLPQTQTQISQAQAQAQTPTQQMPTLMQAQSTPMYYGNVPYGQTISPMGGYSAPQHQFYGYPNPAVVTRSSSLGAQVVLVCIFFFFK
ncbi:hypothetical protein RFI_02288 [Reticulomyxa filosa]|uniref:Uncharacterized protein n=1 Tax=Reticulomyxa filosa TaxID=46433 RepID=X6P9K3_RETFI|nr:hypothetical protein RFI_02288 [Reticulomyxa filosa]|eukprot:ETO34798.1 hypothetical protein RFI_02288 [Reticulomyxa filosa]